MHEHLDSPHRSMQEIYEQVPPDYWDREARKNIFQRLWHYETIRTVWRAIEKLPYKAKILDIGCGSGTSLEKVTKTRLDLVVHGVDVAKTLIEYARKTRPHIVFHVGEGEHLPFSNNEFDALLYLDVLEHLIDLNGGLKEGSRVLKPGGTLIVLVALESNPLFRIMWWVWMHSRGSVWHDAHLRIFTKKSLREAIEKAGFKIQKIKSVNIGMSVVLTAQKTTN